MLWFCTTSRRLTYWFNRRFYLTGWLWHVLHPAIPFLWMGGRLQPDGVVVAVSAPGNSPPVEGWQASLDGVVVAVLHQSIPLLWRGGRLQPDGVVAWRYLHPAIPLLWRGGRLRLTGWLWRFCISQFPSCGGVAGFA